MQDAAAAWSQNVPANHAPLPLDQLQSNLHNVTGLWTLLNPVRLSRFAGFGRNFCSPGPTSRNQAVQGLQACGRAANAGQVQVGFGGFPLLQVRRPQLKRRESSCLQRQASSCLQRSGARRHRIRTLLLQCEHMSACSTHPADSPQSPHARAIAPHSMARSPVRSLSGMTHTSQRSCLADTEGNYTPLATEQGVHRRHRPQEKS
jgi:hypothetical protein